MNQIDQVKLRIRDFVVRECLGEEIASELTNSTDLFETRILDSFSALHLIAFIEREFSVQFDAEDLDTAGFLTVDTIASIIDSKTVTT